LINLYLSVRYNWLSKSSTSVPVTGEFSEIEETILSMQIGAGFDIPLSSDRNKTQFVLSPFVSFQPYFDKIHVPQKLGI
jgi:hypothetical protein